MKRFVFLIIVLCLGTAMFANTTQTVSQVTDAVTVGDDVDYVITSTTPFGENGKVSISGNSTVILKNVIPSLAKLLLTDHVLIDGVKAVRNSNCKLKIYGNGSIIVTYNQADKPFVGYSEQNQQGEAFEFPLGNSRVSLAGKESNNKFQSIYLKRGYYVCLATKSDGKGYSRVFIADKEDKKLNLPAILRGTVSSVRVMQWNDCGKRGSANCELSNLKATWYYDWNCGGSASDDWEYVPQHHHEGWPSISDIGSSNHSPHALGNNEPDNQNDSKEQYATVDEVLANWPEMMATGKRLGSPAMSGNLNWLYAFIDSIDKRGWRCDFIAVHAYWYSDWSSWQSTLSGIHNRTGRPIWITEMNYGANWTGWPGSDRTGSATNFAIEKQHFAPVIDGLESTGWMERYAVYNWVEDCRSMYLNGQLTPMGEYYANKETQVGYDAQYEKVPNIPQQYAPSRLVAKYDKSNGEVVLTWHETNGEFNQSMVIQQKKTGSSIWTDIAIPEQQEDEADYTYIVSGAKAGYKYRISIVDAKNAVKTSNEATAVTDNLEAGDEVMVGDSVMYMGGNMLKNGDFDLGLYDWENGAGEPLSAPYFQAMKIGGQDGGEYLQCYGTSETGETTSAQAVRKKLLLKPGHSYYVSMAGCNGNDYQRISTTSLEKVELNIRAKLSTIDQWATQASSFTVSKDTICLIQLRNLQGKVQIDKVRIAELFATQEEALANAAMVEAEHDSLLSEKLRKENEEEYGYLLQDAATVEEYAVPGYEAVVAARESGDADSLQNALDACLQYVKLTDKIQGADFSSTSGWNLAAGTYKGGDQRTATQAGKSCWNAWWSVSATSASSPTMEINQDLKKLSHGLYALECKATTQHYCEADQKAFMKVQGVQGFKSSRSVASEVLPYGVLDIPGIEDADKWVTVVTPYVYVDEDDTLTIGFKGSKDGAVDGSYIAYGNPTATPDNREGWWCATDFRLRQIPMLCRQNDGSNWGTVCLSYQMTVPENVTLYQIAGITKDSTRICLEAAESFETGTPYVYRCDGEKAVFFETGTKVSSPKTNVNGLRGVFTATAKYPVGALVLTNGRWKNVKERYEMTDYSGYIQKVSNLTVLDKWTGLSLPTDGLVEVLLGDANQDGVVDVADITAIAGYILAPEALNAEQGFSVRNADVNQDGVIDVADITATAGIILNNE